MSSNFPKIMLSKNMCHIPKILKPKRSRTLPRTSLGTAYIPRQTPQLSLNSLCSIHSGSSEFFKCRISFPSSQYRDIRSQRSIAKSTRFDSGCLAMCRGDVFAVIARLMPKSLRSGWKWQRRVKDIDFPFPCCPVNRECSQKKTQIEKNSDKRNLLINPFHSDYLAMS